MVAGERGSLLRPASWSLTIRGAVFPSVGLVLMAVVLGVLINQTVVGLELEAFESNFEGLAEEEAERLAAVLGRRLDVGGLGGLAGNEVIVVRADERTAAAREGVSVDESEVAADVRQQISLFLLGNQHYPFLMVVDRNGMLIYGSSDTGQFDYSGEEWYGRVTSGLADGLYLSDRRDTTSIAGVQGVEIALPVLNANGQLVGALYAVWDPTVDTEVNFPPFGDNRRVMVIDRRGAVVLDTDGGIAGELALSEEVVGEVQSPRQAGGSATGQVGSTIGFDEQGGSRRVYGYSNLARHAPFPFGPSFLGLDWTVVASEDANALLFDARILVRRILVLLAAGILLVVSASFVFARALTAPLGRLTVAAQRIGAGQLETVIPELGEDEVGRLADVLRGTVAQLVGTVNRLRVVARVTSKAQSMQDLGAMLQYVSNAIHDDFGFGQVRIYLLDADGESLTLEAAAGNVDARLRKQRHRVLLSADNIVGRALQTGQYEVSRGDDTASGSGFELVMPLRSASERLGSIYVATVEESGFTLEDINVIELLADQMSASVQSSRLFERSEASLREIEALNRRLTREGWTKYMGDGGNLRYTSRGAGGEETWPVELVSVVDDGELVVKSKMVEDEGALLAVPISLGGEVIGTLGIRRREGYEWSDDEISLVETVAERVASIAEGIRRLDESDSSARREQQLSAMSANLQSAAEVDSLLQMALSELSGVLGSDSVSLRIGSPPVEGGPDVLGGEADGDEV